MNMNDPEHIWLRQTVTYMVDGQTRTLEIGVPVPRNATEEEVEELLRAADAGMRAITRRLDAQIAAAAEGGDAPQRSALPPAPGASSGATERASVNGRAAAGSASAPEPEPATHTPPRAPAGAPAAPTPTSTPAATPAATSAASARAPEPAAVPQRPAAPPVAPARPPAPASASANSAEMTRPEFLAAASELGLNPRQAMDRLKVRSLEGLNLREALESLRRQMLGAPDAAAPEPEPLPATSPTPGTAPDSEARYFEEEDDETIFFTADDEDEALDEEPAPPAGGPATRAATGDTGEDDEDALEAMDDEIDLEDVPDLAPPAPASRRRAAPAREAVAPPAAPAIPATPAATSGARTQAMQLIGKLRAATGGGPASDYQRNAYRNIVEDELGKTQATALVRGLWRTTADRLSAGQLDALIRWGKEEVFAEEALLVLAALRAEQRRAEQSDEPAPRATSRGRAAAPREGER